MAIKAKSRDAEISIQELKQGVVRFNVVGTSPMIMNRFQQKAWRELLFPSPTKTAAEKAVNLKHDPLAEFRGSMYRNRDNNTPTLVHLPNGAFHGAIASAALDIPGATKSKIERLTSVLDPVVEVFGTPMLFMSMVRSSDMNRTPDVRTRAIFPEWACTIQVSYIKNIITEQAIGNLLGGAGIIVGIGDWRPQKGGPYGRYRLVGDNDKNLDRIRKQGIAAQRSAYDTPEYYDPDTAELMEWFLAELHRRERHAPSQNAPAGVSEYADTGDDARDGSELTKIAESASRKAKRKNGGDEAHS